MFRTCGISKGAFCALKSRKSDIYFRPPLLVEPWEMTNLAD